MPYKNPAIGAETNKDPFEGMTDEEIKAKLEELENIEKEFAQLAESGKFVPIV